MIVPVVGGLVAEPLGGVEKKGSDRGIESRRARQHLVVSAHFKRNGTREEDHGVLVIDLAQP